LNPQPDGRSVRDKILKSGAGGGYVKKVHKVGFEPTT
jgi:hypothetical protein